MNKITLLNCDCMLHMKDIPDKFYDLAIVDPPYGIGADVAQNNTAEQRIKANGKSKAGRGWLLYKKTDWDNQIPMIEYWEQLFRISKNQMVCGGNYFIKYLYPSMGWVVWNKMQRDFSLADGELIWTSFDVALRIFDLSRGESLADNNNGGKRFHPTQKPVKLYKWLLKNYAKPEFKIIDSHGGSMSSVIACIDGGFEMTCFEIDKDYYDSAEQRIESYFNQLNIFNEKPEIIFK